MVCLDVCPLLQVSHSKHAGPCSPAGFTARLASDTELTQLLRNTWILLSR